MKSPKIVTIGGGTGSFMLLTGLKKYAVDLTAIVSMADDGGSTGMLRDELGVLPPGDIRQCLVALNDSSDILRKLLNYRFDKGKLTGHNFGNLFLSALERITGSFEEAIAEATRILNVHGTVIPVTIHDARLFMTLHNGKTLSGEHKINITAIQKVGIKKIGYKPSIPINPRAVKAIKHADLIVIGPGNIYSSIIPNLLIRGMRQALSSSKAKKIYICNLTNKRGHTLGYSVIDYVQTLEKYLGSSCLDYIIANTEKPTSSLMQRYARKEGNEFFVSLGSIPEKRHYKIVTGRFLNHAAATYDPSDILRSTRSFIRHNSDKIAQSIVALMTSTHKPLFRIK